MDIYTMVQIRAGYDCYETIIFGKVTHTLDAPAMRVRSFVYVIHIL